MRRAFTLLLCSLLLFLCGCGPSYPEYPIPDGNGSHTQEFDDESGLIHVELTVNSQRVKSDGHKWRRVTDVTGKWVIDDPVLAITEHGFRIGLHKPAETGPALSEPLYFSLEPPAEAEGSWIRELSEDECPYIRDHQLRVTYTYTVTNLHTGETREGAFSLGTP